MGNGRDGFIRLFPYEAEVASYKEIVRGELLFDDNGMHEAADPPGLA